MFAETGTAPGRAHRARWPRSGGMKTPFRSFCLKKRRGFPDGDLIGNELDVAQVVGVGLTISMLWSYGVVLSLSSVFAIYAGLSRNPDVLIAARVTILFVSDSHALIIVCYVVECVRGRVQHAGADRTSVVVLDQHAALHEV